MTPPKKVDPEYADLFDKTSQLVGNDPLNDPSIRYPGGAGEFEKKWNESHRGKENNQSCLG